MLNQKGIFCGFLLALIVLFSSCQNNFEKLRLSNDTDLKLKKAFEFYEASDYLKAQYLFEDLIGEVRLTDKAEKVYFHYAYTHFHLENYSFASYYFKQFSTTYPNGKYAEEALFMSADAFYRLSPSYRLTQEDTKSAIEGLQIFANSYPQSEKVAACNERIDNLRAKLELKALHNANGYFQRKRYQSAVHSFKSMLIDFPDTQEGEHIRYMIIKSLAKYAQKSVLSKQIERYQEALKSIEEFEIRYETSKLTDEVSNIKTAAINKIKRIRNEH